MMIAPDRIWHEVVTTNNMAELSVFGTRPDDWNSENFIEYARVTPGTITLPRAEVEALMGIADEIATVFIGIEFEQLQTALATLQERMK